MRPWQLPKIYKKESSQPCKGLPKFLVAILATYLSLNPYSRPVRLSAHVSLDARHLAHDRQYLVFVLQKRAAARRNGANERWPAIYTWAQPPAHVEHYITETGLY